MASSIDTTTALLETATIVFTTLGYGVLGLLSVGLTVAMSIPLVDAIAGLRYSGSTPISTAAQDRPANEIENEPAKLMAVIVSIIAWISTFMVAVANDTGLHPAATAIVSAAGVLVFQLLVLAVAWLVSVLIRVSYAERKDSKKTE